MKALTAQTKAELRTRINKGQSLLDPAHKILFAAWTNDYMDNCHRTVAKFTKADLIKAFTKTANLYRAQCAATAQMQSDRRFDNTTSSWKELAQQRAAQMRERMREAKELAIKTGKSVQVKVQNIRA